MYSIDPPSGVLDDKMPWYTAKVGARTWDILKAKLTGGIDSGGTGYSSTVNLSDADADRLIENMKKDPRGYPQFNDAGGGMGFYENYEKYQAWLVESYLDKEPEREEEDIPEGLDDLLGSIQNEPVEPKVTVIQSSAIVPSKFFGKDGYDKYRDELTATGTIDGEYLTSKERKEAFKKRNDKIGFQEFVENVLERKKSADKFTSDTTEVKGGAIVKAPKIDPGKLVSIETGDKTNENLNDILKIVTSIHDTLIKQNEFDKKQLNQERRSAERERRAKKEKGLESGIFKGLARATEKVLAPVKGMFEKIFDFIKTVILGNIVMNILKWMGDPENERKINNLIRFFKDFWPVIVGAFLLFGTKFGGLIRTLGGWALKIIRFAVPKLLRFVLRNRKAAGALAIAGGVGMLGARILTGTEVGADEEEGEQTPEQQQEAEFRAAQTTAIASLREAEAAEAAEAEPEVKPVKMSKGGRVPGSGNKDTVPAMLTPGEFVMSKGAVAKYGTDTMRSMNASGGGTGIPNLMPNGVFGYSTGGSVSDKEEPGGRNNEGTEKPKPSGNFLTKLFGGGQNKPPATPTESIIPRTDKSSTAKNPIVASMGFSQEDFDVFRNVIASIESGGKYDIAGGSGGHYDGRYQLGAAAKTDGARYAGVENPGHTPEAREAFRKNPQLQEVLFAGFTKANHTYLMGNTEYKNANPRRKLQILGYAHNQGMGGAEKWMTTGVVGSDGFGTKGTKYTDSIATAFKTGKVPSVSAPSSSGTMIASGSGSSSSSTGSTATTTKTQTAPLPKFDYNKIRQELGIKTSSVSKSSRPSSTAAYSQMQGDTSQAAQIQNSNNDASGDVPSFDAAAMTSLKKIKTLGITV